MGQQEIEELLREQKRPMAGREIAELLDESSKKIFKLINKLLENDDILFIELDRVNAKKLFNSNKRMKLYYHKEIKINKRFELSKLEEAAHSVK